MSSSVLEEIQGSYTHVLKGLEIGRMGIIPSGNFSEILCCAMGGSALPAQLLQDHVSSRIRVSISHEYAVPSFVDPAHTLVVLSSYSGSTEEIIAAFEDAHKKRCALVVITHGGKLAERARELGYPVFHVPTSPYPRYTVGYGLGILLGILEKMGVVEDTYALLKQTENALSTQMEAIDGLAREYAGVLKGTVPILYSASPKAALGRVVKIYCNETAKTQSFSGELPEANHNEMVGFTHLLLQPTFVFLRSASDHERVTLRMDVMKAMMEERGIRCLDLLLQGEHFFGETSYGLLFAYLLSYYLALEYGVDPLALEMVDELKRRLG